MSTTKTLKKFGFWSIVLLTINSIIGTGIFLTPAGVMKSAGTYTPLVYLVAAIFAGVLAITFASSAKYVNKNGASYAYAKAAFGDNVGLYVGLTRFISSAIAWGVMATAVVRTTLSIFIGADNITNSKITIGFVILMSVLFAINMFGNHFVEKINNISTIGKLVALVTAIVAGFVIFISTGENHFSQVNGLIPDFSMNFTSFVGATIAAFYAFTGFESVASAASEMENPEKNLPRAIPLAMAIIAAVYIGVVSIAMVISPEAILNSKEVVVLASAFSNPLIKNIVIYGALVSMFGINVAASFSTPKVFQAMASEGQLPKELAKVNEKGVPVASFIVTVAVAVIIPMSFRYDTTDIMVISAISRFVQFLVVPVGVILFFRGKAKNKQDILVNAHRNPITDVFIPLVGLFMTLVLLYKFNWVGQFSLETDAGLILNWYAIGAMVTGFVIFPAIVMLYHKFRKINA